MMLIIFADLRQQGKMPLVCSHEWGESLNRRLLLLNRRLLLLNRRLLTNDTPQAIMTMENIQQAYGANIQAALHSQNDILFAC
ncbi:MAG: hypothetical protein AAGD25_41205 [Cyanobacteria bacterium P01_F01_bin.150]